MSLLNNIKVKLHSRSLRKELKSLGNIVRNSSSFNTAQKIGILFNATSLDEEKIVMDYVERLRTKNKKRVSILGFKDTKEEQKVNLFKQYNLNDLNWLLIPKSEEINSFVNQSFDIVINFMDKPLNHAEYIMAKSKAKFRVGRNSSNVDAYELMINEKEKDTKHYIKLLDTYLQTFNEKPNEPQTV